MTLNALSFGSFLAVCRKKAGFHSLSEVAFVLKKERSKGVQLSKARLSLYERGRVSTIKPEILKVLAKVYNVDYEELATRWFQAQYLLEAQTLSLQKLKEEVVRISPGSNGEDQSLISVNRFAEIQAALPDASQVIVAALHFIDDTVFFDMVSENIRRGIGYVYLCPKSSFPMYSSFIQQLSQKFPNLRGKIDGKLTHFVPRQNFDLPYNGVVYVLPKGKLEAYVGLLDDMQPVMFQRADQRLTARMLDSFRWALHVGADEDIQKRFELLERKLLKTASDDPKEHFFGKRM